MPYNVLLPSIIFILWDKTGVLQLKQLVLQELATLMEMAL